MKLSNFWRYWLPLVALSLFVSRCLYEWNPLRFALLGDWINVLPITLAVVVLVRWAANFVHRRRPTWRAPDLSSFLLLLIYVVWPPVDLLWASILLLGAIALFATHYTLPQHARWFDLAVGLIALLLYLVTLGDHVGRADTFEFQVVAPQLGIAHPTGYPLFIIIGKLFSLLPVGSMAWRVNLASALFATLAVWLIYRTISLLTSDRLAAAIAALALAASPVFWSQAVVAEVYALNALFVAAILFLLIKLLGSRSDPQPLTSNSQFPTPNFYLLFFLFGLAVSHHLTSVILIPAIVSTFFLARPQLSRKMWLIGSGLFLFGLTPWLFIYLRWPALHNGAWMTIGEWLNWIFGQRFGGALDLALWLDPTRWGIVTRLVMEQFESIGLGLALGGLIVLIRQNWRIALITLVTFTGYVFYGLVYNVPDVAVFMIPAFMLLAVWTGIAIAFVVQASKQIVSYVPRLSAEDFRPALYLLFAVLPLWQIAGNFAATNQHGLNADQEAWGRYVLSLPIPERAALLVDSEKIAPLYYLQVTEHLRPDLDIVVLGDEALYQQELDRRLNEGQSVYLARFLPNLPYHMRALGPLVEVSREPLSTVPTIGQTLNASFGDQIELLGSTAEAGNPYRLTLYWKATSPQRPNYHVRLRLVDAQSKTWWADPGAYPVNGYYPTGAWSLDEVVSDFHEVPIEPFLLPGTYNLEVGLFTPFRLAGLTVKGSSWLKVAQVQVIAPQATVLPHEVRMTYEQTLLTALDELGTAPPESQVTLRVNTLGATTDATLALIRDGALYASLTPTLRSGQNLLQFTAPEFWGKYEVRLATGKVARCHWFAEVTSSCVLGTLQVEGEAIGDAINFENQVVLEDAQLGRDQVSPGETLQIDLTWRGLKKWPDDYTAFVHLLGPDGQVHGQIDQWPVQGTLPTSSWTAGQVVDDPYSVTLPPNAPAGKYQVEVGWYLLATLRRLNVLDAAGHPSDDHVIVGEFTVP